MLSSSVLRQSLGALLVTTLVAAASACGNSGPQTPSGGAATTDTIHVWVLDDKINPVQESAVAEFNKTAKVKAVVEKFGNKDYSDKVRIAMGSPNAPDVFWNWGGGSIASYVTAGQLLDLTPTLQADQKFKDAFLPSVLDAGKIDGKNYGIPLRGMQPVILFYNKDVFSRAGAQPPKTWAEVLSLIDTFKKAKVTPFAVAGAGAWTELMWVEYLVDRFGGAQVFADIAAGKPDAWKHPAVLKAAQAVRDLVDRGAFGTNYASVDYTSTGGASTLFARGKAAMHLMGSWEFANQLQAEPKFAANGLGFTAFPAIEGGAGDPAAVVGNPTNYFSVNSKSKHTDVAVEFLKKMAGDAYTADLLKAGDVPTTTSAGDKLTQNPNPDFAAFQYQMVQKAPSFTLSWDQALSPSVGQTVVTAIQKLFNKQLSPEQFVAEVEQAK
ncbi:MAG TPA: extracellular solute-binding protein [Catenuloplanes sp.]